MAKQNKAWAQEAGREQREELFDEVLRLLPLFVIEDVALVSGVSKPTLYAWMDGRVMCPSTRTLFPVARALGLEITFRRPRGATTAQRRLRGL